MHMHMPAVKYEMLHWTAKPCSVKDMVHYDWVTFENTSRFIEV